MNRKQQLLGIQEEAQHTIDTIEWLEERKLWLTKELYECEFALKKYQQPLNTNDK